MYQITGLFTHLRKFAPKNCTSLAQTSERTLRYGWAYAPGGLMRRGGLYERVLIRGATQVIRERCAYLRGSLYAGGRFIGGEIRYSISDPYRGCKIPGLP